jgi:hypothetical protein
LDSFPLPHTVYNPSCLPFGPGLCLNYWGWGEELTKIYQRSVHWTRGAEQLRRLRSRISASRWLLGSWPETRKTLAPEFNHHGHKHAVNNHVEITLPISIRKVMQALCFLLFPHFSVSKSCLRLILPPG